jgi:prolyl 4-hydroxylase
LPKSLSDYVKVYERTLSPETCRALIERFEAEPALQERKQAERSYNFVEINVSRHWPEVEAQVHGILMACVQRYWEQLDVGASWPAKVWAEKMRLKRYMPGGQDAFPTHVDVMDDDQSKRFLTAILYLNDCGGGETVFPGLDITVTPAPGRMVMFPPLWLFPHAGLPPRDRAKYILHRYLWYPPATERVS